MCFPCKLHFQGCPFSSICCISPSLANYPLIINCYKLFITAKGGHRILLFFVVAAWIKYLILSDRSSIVSERWLNLLLIMHTDRLHSKDWISYRYHKLIHHGTLCFPVSERILSMVGENVPWESCKVRMTSRIVNLYCQYETQIELKVKMQRRNCSYFLLLSFRGGNICIMGFHHFRKMA